MAKSEKTYYFLKLEKDFFDKKEIRLLRKVAGGDTYTIIYLKMLLMALSDEGIFYFENIGENIAEEVALTIDEDVENVSVTLAFLQKKGLLEIVETDKYYLNSTPEMVGKLTSNALRQRKFRDRKNQETLQSNAKALQNNTPVTQNNVEKEIDIEIDIEQEQQLEQEEKNNVAGVGENIIFKKLKEAFGEMSVSGTMVIEVEDLLKVHGQTLVLYALDQTILNAGRSIRYTRSILERWKGQGLNTVEQIQQNQEARDQQKLKSKSQMTPEEWRQSLKEPDPRYGF